MKIIEALKKTKELQKKADDLKEKICNNCSISSVDTPLYEDQSKQISEWLQAHSDVLKEKLRLQIAIQKTNIETFVDIEIGGKTISKSIAEWIHRRRDLSKQEKRCWAVLTDRGIIEGISNTPSGGKIEIKIQRFYDPKKKDEMISLFDSEPYAIDSKLEIVNAITDLTE